jgi:hypothetical protein
MITTQSNLLRERAIRNVTVEGTGVLAAQIALQAAYHDFKVIAYDINDAVPEKARARFKGLHDTCTGTTCARRRVRSTANIQPLPQCQPGQGREERRPFDRSCSRKHGVEEVVPHRTRMQFAAVNLRLSEWNRSCSNRVMRTPAHRDLCMLKERL